MLQNGDSWHQEWNRHTIKTYARDRSRSPCPPGLPGLAKDESGSAGSADRVSSYPSLNITAGVDQCHIYKDLRVLLLLPLFTEDNSNSYSTQFAFTTSTLLLCYLCPLQSIHYPRNYASPNHPSCYRCRVAGYGSAILWRLQPGRRL